MSDIYRIGKNSTDLSDIYGVKLKALEKWVAETKGEQSVKGNLLNFPLCN